MQAHEKIVPARKITGYSAILLPFTKTGTVDWEGFESHLTKTIAAGLIPAVNMDTGYANLIDSATKIDVLERTRDLVAGREFVAGAFVADKPGDSFRAQEYRTEMDLIQKFGGVPVIFQSYGLTNGPDRQILENYRQLAGYCDRFIGFELGKVFLPLGKIYSLELYQELIQIPQCIGAKHSSLHRQPEWDRLEIRDRIRPEFRVLTGNDLAIDMVKYGSDYLLGLSTFAPDLFAKRDHFWATADNEFYELNDVLQYLGFFAFRVPTGAYKHSAAQFLKLRGWIATDETHINSGRRPESDTFVLQEILERLQRWID